MEPSSSSSKPKAKIFQPTSEKAKLVLKNMPKAIKQAIKEAQENPSLTDEERKYFVGKYTHLGKLHNFVKHCYSNHEFGLKNPSRAQESLLKKIDDANRRITEITEELNSHIEVSDDDSDICEEDMWETIEIKGTEFIELDALIEEFINDPVNRKKHSCGLINKTMLALINKLPEKVKEKIPEFEGKGRYKLAADSLYIVKPKLREAMLERVTEKYLQNEQEKVHKEDPLGAVVVDKAKQREIDRQNEELIKEHSKSESTEQDANAELDVVELESEDSDRDYYDDENDSDAELVTDTADDGDDAEADKDSDVEFVEEVHKALVAEDEDNIIIENSDDDKPQTEPATEEETSTIVNDIAESVAEEKESEPEAPTTLLTGQRDNTEQMDVDAAETETEDNQLAGKTEDIQLAEKENPKLPEVIELDTDEDVDEVTKDENVPDDRPASTGSSIIFEGIEPAAKRSKSGEEVGDELPNIS